MLCIKTESNMVQLLPSSYTALSLSQMGPTPSLSHIGQSPSFKKREV